MKKLTKTLSLVLVVAMVLSLCVIGASATFTDKDKITKDYSEAVAVMTDLGCVAGVGNNAFNPAGTFTRAQAAVILTRLTLGASADNYVPSKVSFSDVPTTFWGYKYIEYAVQSGYVAGVGNGKYNPNATLTGYQWAAMLLKVLNITVPTTGSDWQINTAKAYYGENQFSTVTISAANVTREAATQMAYDALFTSMNGSKGYPVYKYATPSTKSANDTLIGVYDSLADAAVAVAALGTTNYYYETKTTSMGTSTLAYTVFGVTKTPNSVGTYGRPATLYSAKTKTESVAYGWGKVAGSVKYFNATPDYTTTTAVQAKTVYAALGVSAASITTTDLLNGSTGRVGSAVALTANGTSYIGGNGVLTEFYVTDSTAGAEKVTMVQVQYKLGYVSSVATIAATSAVGAHTVYLIDNVKADSNVYVADSSNNIGSYSVFSTTVTSADKDGCNITGTIAKDNYVLISTDATATVGTTYIQPATMVSGNLTGKTATTYTIGGTAYGISATPVTSTPTAALFDSTLFSTTKATSFAVDSYGYVIAPTKTATTDVYVYVDYATNTWTLSSTTGTMTPTVTAYAVDATGALVTKNVSYIESSAVNGTSVSATNLSKGVYKVTTLTDGTYKMEVQNGMTFTAASFNYASGDPTIALSTKGNAATVFYTVNKTSGVPSSVTTTTGMASMGSMTNVDGGILKDTTTGLAKVVFIDTGVSANATNYVYYLGSFNYDGTNTLYDVIAAGGKTTVKNTTGFGVEGFYNISNSNVASAPTPASFAFDTATPANGADGVYVSNATSTYALQNVGGLLYMRTTTVATGAVTPTYLAPVGSTVPVYTISASADTVTTGTAADLSTIAAGNTIIVALNSAKTAIAAIYVSIA